jgi:RNA polymerase sigma-70 factor, ECF subfamily
MNPMWPDNEQELIDRLMRGDAGAFDQFFNEYYPRIYRFARRRVRGDSSLAEDVAQAVLCRALESLQTYRGEAALMTWLCTLCRREMSQQCRVKDDEPEIREALESLLIANQADLINATHDDDVKESVLAALDYLPVTYADVLERKYLRDMSVNAIATQLGRSVKATESLLTRARAAFREAFLLLDGDSRSMP